MKFTQKNKLQVVRKHFNTIAPVYDEKCKSRKNYLKSIDKLVLSNLSKIKNPKILDVGCGTGSRSEMFKKKLVGSKITGVEISTEMLKIAMKTDLDKIVHSSFTNLPLKANSFDAVICLFNTFGYLTGDRQRKRALSEIERVLRKGGIFIIDVMNFWHTGEGIKYRRILPLLVYDWLVSFFDPRISIKDKLFALNLNGKRVRGFVHGFTKNEMSYLLKNAGFSIKDFYIIGYDTGGIKEFFWEGQYLWVCIKD